jgi:hypothetical protein
MGRLIRILFACAIAVVVTVRMEAAAEHCRKLTAAAETAIPVPAAEAAPCHGAHDAPAPQPAHHPDGNSPERCECLAVLAGFVAYGPAISSAGIEPYAWARPLAVGFASIEPAPDWRPPKA